MSSESTQSLVSFARFLLIYGGIAMIVLGMFGSFMVIIIFSQRPFNINPCSIYIKAIAVLSFLFLPLYFLPNIVTFGLEINWLSTNGAFCKFQMSYGVFTITSIFILNCLVAFDRYVITSTSVRIRSIHSSRAAFFFTMIGLIFAWTFFGVPGVILFDSIPENSLNGTNICTSNSRMFLAVTAIMYFPLIEGIAPIVFVICFHYLTRRQLRNLQAQTMALRFDRQITRIYTYQLIVSAVASFPFALINLYRSLTIDLVRTEDQKNILQFCRILAIFLFYIQYSCDFYIYCLTCNEIRLRAREMLCVPCGLDCCRV